MKEYAPTTHSNNNDEVDNVNNTLTKSLVIEKITMITMMIKTKTHMNSYARRRVFGVSSVFFIGYFTVLIEY